MCLGLRLETLNGEQELDVKMLCVRVLCEFVTTQGVRKCHPYDICKNLGTTPLLGSYKTTLGVTWRTIMNMLRL